MPGTPNAPKVRVTVGPVPSSSADGKFQQVGPTNAVWSDYLITMRYEKDYRRYMLGVTSPEGVTGTGGGKTVAFVQLSNPTLLWVVDWTAARLGEKPSVPSTDVDPNWVLLDERFEPGTVVVGPDGITPYYRISGTYFYGQSKPSANTIDDLSFARPPFIKDAFNRSVPKSMFEKGLIDRR